MKIVSLIFFMAMLTSSFAAINDNKIQLLKDPQGKNLQLENKDIVSLERFEKMFSMDARTAGLHAMLKRHAFKHMQKGVPVLIKVMKNNKYPEQNRWHATMLLAQIMGEKSAPFIAKFSAH